MYKFSQALKLAHVLNHTVSTRDCARIIWSSAAFATGSIADSNRAIAPGGVEPIVRNVRTLAAGWTAGPEQCGTQQPQTNLSAEPHLLGVFESGLESEQRLSRNRPQGAGVVGATSPKVT